MPIHERLSATGKRFYSVCFSIRSGSTLLCNDMAQWGLGLPTEYFQFPDSPVLEGSVADHLVNIVEQTPGQWFGIKLAWEQVYQLTSRLRHEGDTAVGFDLRTVFPDLRHIHIVRTDKVSQAVSAWRAASSQTWHWPVGTEINPGRPDYDFESIKPFFLQVIAEDWLWQSYFAEFEIQPLIVNYEDYLEDRIGQLSRVARFLGEDTSSRMLEEQLHVMRDDWTKGIVEMVRADLYAPREPNWAHPLGQTSQR